MVAIPMVRGVCRLSTYVKLEMGDVPNEALIIITTPRVRTYSPKVNVKYRFIRLFISKLFKVLSVNQPPHGMYGAAYKSMTTLR